ncbi:MAG TPA: 4-oxalocrotonate tautomerase family protein [Methanosarcina sp.]|nr:4-oxalocrotonate tautomerase family protein [Methanosarcina sp.]
MPIIEVKLWEGRPRDQKKRIANAITDAFVKEGVSADAVHVVFHDIPKGDWCIAGKPCDE